jgi:hypothetical protein
MGVLLPHIAMHCFVRSPRWCSCGVLFATVPVVVWSRVCAAARTPLPAGAARRPSCVWHAPKTRPLAVKLEMMLKLMCHRFDFLVGA